MDEASKRLKRLRRVAPDEVRARAQRPRARHLHPRRHPHQARRSGGGDLAARLRSRGRRSWSSGTHGRRGVRRVLLGSVAEGVVRLAPCDVAGGAPGRRPCRSRQIEPPCPECIRVTHRERTAPSSGARATKSTTDVGMSTTSSAPAAASASAWPVSARRLTDGTRYRRKSAFADSSAGEAVRLIRRGRRIMIGSGAAEPAALVEALVTHGDHLADNEIVHLLTLGPAPYVAAGLEQRFRHTAFFIGAERARGRPGGARRFHAGVPVGDPAADPEPPRPDRCRPDPGFAARRRTAT